MQYSEVEFTQIENADDFGGKCPYYGAFVFGLIYFELLDQLYYRVVKLISIFSVPQLLESHY